MLTLTRDSTIQEALEDIVVQPAYEWILSGGRGQLAGEA
jgi:hypothetical protein